MLQRFRRVTSGSSWIPQIDGLRFIAIASVILSHAFSEVVGRGPRIFTIPYRSHWITDLFIQGGRGVGLFFVISGYILSRPFLRESLLDGHPVKMGRYFLRRITRLEPPYILSLVLYFVAQSLFLPVGFRYETEHVLASMVYLHSQIFPYIASPNFVTWTLEIEIQFYILAPLLALVFRMQRTSLRRIVLVLCIALATAIRFHGGQRFQLSVFAYLHFFLAGFLLCDLLEYPRHAPRQAWWWDIVSLCGWPACFLLGADQSLAPWLPLLLVPLVLAAFHGKASNWFLRQPVIALTGGMCYSIYLMHMLVFSSVFRRVRYIQFGSVAATIATQMALLVLSALVVSAGYFLLIERPCMDPDWPQKLYRKLLPQSRQSVVE